MTSAGDYSVYLRIEQSATHETVCTDSLDDDLDGSTDCDDSDCSTDTACTETDSECINGVDDDGDGYTDCSDSDCD